VSRGPVVEFTTSASPRGDRAIKSLIEQSVERIVSSLGADLLTSVILTGAMSRGEGSALEREDGRITVLSDLDLYLVVNSETDLEPLRERVWSLARTFREDVPRDEMASSFDLAPVRVEDIASVRPEIGTVDLRNRGRVVWGRNVLSNLPPLDAASIHAQDAVTLVFNRIAEELLYYPGMGESDEEMRLYHSAKTGADLALAILALLGEYRPTYRERAETLQEIWPRPEMEWLRHRVPNLPERIASWTAYKLIPDHGVLEERMESGPRGAISETVWRSLVPVVEAVWTWGIRRWTGATQEEPLALVGEIGRMDSPRERVRGWRAAWRHHHIGRGPAALWRMVLGLTRGSPRSLLHSATSLVYFAAPARNGSGHSPERARAYLDGARRLMPAAPRSQASDWASLRAALLEYWKKDVMHGTR